MSYAEDAGYLDEKVLKPLQRAVNLVRELGEVESLLRQKQEHVTRLDFQLNAATNKYNELSASIERIKANMTEQRMELQALLQEDRRMREQERTSFVQIREQLKEANQLEREQLVKIQKEREQAEKELFALKNDVQQRYRALQAIGE